MKPLYYESQLLSAKSTDKLPLECYYCSNTFYIRKSNIIFEIKNDEGRRKFCSVKCKSKSLSKKMRLNCTNCKTKFYKYFKDYKKCENHFCSRSCAATYNNKNKSTGNRRSKLEIWLEQQLIRLYPKLDIKFNDKETIGSELDIYIPSLNIAFELNGIFHYEPIYGNDKLQQIQENDQSKSKACHDLKIDLCVIDTSQQNRFKSKTSKKYLDIITTIINQRTLLL